MRPFSRSHRLLSSRSLCGRRPQRAAARRLPGPLAAGRDQSRDQNRVEMESRCGSGISRVEKIGICVIGWARQQVGDDAPQGRGPRRRRLHRRSRAARRERRPRHFPPHGAHRSADEASSTSRSRWRRAALMVVKAQARYDGGYWNTTGHRSRGDGPRPARRDARRGLHRPRPWRDRTRQRPAALRALHQRARPGHEGLRALARLRSC